MGLSRTVILGLFSCLLATSVYGIQLSHYTNSIYYGDIDGDGDIDIYLDGGETFVPIHSDIIVPILLSRDSVVLYRQGSQYSSPQLTAQLSESQLQSLTRASDQVDLFTGDFNGDGASDLLIRGHNSAGLGVTLASTPGATPAILQTVESGSLAGININDRGVNIIIQDNNGDGRSDVVIDDSNSATVNVAYLANSSGVFNNAYSINPDSLLADRQATAYAGSTTGEFKVSESGAATYTIKLALPKGTAGVAPALALNYVSNSGNGLLGQGWSLAGTSGITRCRKTLAIDGDVAPIQWNSHDRLCLDNERLILVSGTYGAAGSEYRTELDSYSRIKAYGGSTGHPSYFKVLRKDGSITFYGHTSESRQTVGGNTLTWAQSRLEDSVGNGVDYFYHNDSHGQRIRSIRYAYGNGQQHHADISFSYEGRPDVISGYLSGHLVQTTQRMTSVAVKNYQNGTWHSLRTYHLNYNKYDPHAHSKRSILGNVQECVSSGCYQATTFDWSDTGSFGSFQPATQISAYHRLYDHVIDRRFLDINGDGLQDMVVLNQDDSQRYDHRFLLRSFISDGNRLVPSDFSGRGHWFEFTDALVDPLVKIETLDYNGDGRQDLAVYRSNVGYWQLHMATPVGDRWLLSGSPINLTHLNSPNYKFADINADGLQDAVSIGKVYHLAPAITPTTDLPYAYHSPQVVTMPTFGPASSTFSSERCGNSETGYYPVSTQYEFEGVTGDVNGDGNVELLVKYTAQCNGTASNHFYTKVLKRGFAVMEKRGNQFASLYTIISNSAYIDLQLSDINGDGLADLLSRGQPSGGNSDWQIRLSTGTGFANAQHITRLNHAIRPQFIDLDNDGDQEFVYDNPFNNKIMYQRFQGASFGSTTTLMSTNGNLGESRSFIDINADNKPDYIRQDRNYLYTQMASHSGQPDNTITTITNGLGAQTDIQYAAIARTNAYAPVDHELSWRYYTNLGYSAVGSRTSTCSLGNCSNALNMSAASQRQFERQQNGELAQGIWDLPANTQTMGSDQPILPVNGSLYVVTSVTSSAPEGSIIPGQVAENSKSAIAYQYSGARIQAAGRGFLGFQYLKTIDLQTQIKTVTAYRQDFPLVGAALKTVTFSPDGKVMQTSENDWGYVKRNGADGTHYYQTILQSSSETGYQVANIGTATSTNSKPTLRVNYNSGGLTAYSNKTKSMDVSYTYDSYGNATQLVEVTQGYDNTGAVNLTQTKTSNNIYTGGSVTLDEWGSVSYEALGRLTASSVTTHLNGNSTTRTSGFTYYNNGPHAGLLRTETVQPDGDLSLTLTTTHTYDNFGNEVQVSTQGWDGEALATRTATNQYDSTGRYVDKTINHFGQTTSQVLERDARGAPTRTLNLSGIETTLNFDDFGREIYRSDSTGAWASTQHLSCLSGCPTGAAYGIKKSVAGGGESAEYFDKVGRKIREGSLGFNGQWVYKQTIYDMLGRVIHQSEPFFALVQPQWSTFTYDALGRTTTVIAPDGSRATKTYNGFSVTTRNAFKQVKTETDNVLGQKIAVVDHIGGRIAYEYNIDGELTQLHSYRSNGDLAATTTLAYDALGRKTSMNDPDKGYWQYTYNAFGELIEQWDAKAQKTTQRYDALGRMVRRTDYRADNTVEGHTTWHFDNNTDTGIDADNARGQLREVVLSADINDTSCFSASTRQCTTHIYDDYGRSVATEVKLGVGGNLGTYRTAIDYDNIGRVIRNYDVMDGNIQAAGNAIISGTATDYNHYGYAYRTTDLQTQTLLQEIVRRDQRGNITEEIKGNGARTYYQYNAATGRMEYQGTSVVGLFALQHITYDWDALGNLIYRHNQSASDDQGSQKNLQESFCYDGLNRLIKTHNGAPNNTTHACGNLTESQQDMRYDSLGNITYKHDVGSYSYASVHNTAASDDAGLHAVTSTSDGYTYHYDNNGNMIEDRHNGVIERRLHYTTFDKPDSISKGDHTTRFAYGHNRSRYWREDTDKDGVVTTTLYLAGVERITQSNRTTITWKRYLKGSIRTIVTDANANQQSTQQRYVYQDHLGSTDIITDANAQIVQSMSFDPWGQRRQSANWQAMTTLALHGFDTSESTKGYTGHEHLDAVGLIHMNGRIYDPRLARFLQADPHIQAPSDTQMLNRYSYVRNNPLNATDPSGYFLTLVIGLAAKLAGATILQTAIMVGITAFAQASMSGANMGQALKAGLIAGISTYAFGKIAKHFNQLGAAQAHDIAGSYYNFGGNLLTSGQIAKQITLHGLVGGISAELMGGKFGHGFFSAGFTKGVMGAAGFDYNNRHLAAIAGRTFTAAMVAGTVSEATGGKFRNGAKTGAIAHLFNAESGAGVKRSKVASAKNILARIDASPRDQLIPINTKELDAIMRLDMSSLETVDSESFEWHAKHRGDGSFFYEGRHSLYFHITDGPLEGFYRGSDINYYYQGFQAANHDVSRAYMNSLIAGYNVAQALGWNAYGFRESRGMREISQIYPAQKFALYGYNTYTSSNR